MNTKQILIDARELIEDEGKWTQQAYARENGGEPCSSEDGSAVKWCAVGAVQKVDGLCSALALDELRKACSGCGVATFNDSIETTHADVLAMYDRAIEAEGGP